MTKEEHLRRNLSDLARVIMVLSEVLEGKELTTGDENRIKYCEKIMKGMKKNINELNKRK